MDKIKEKLECRFFQKNKYIPHYCAIDKKCGNIPCYIIYDKSLPEKDTKHDKP